MSETLKIEYHKTRDFGKKINATIEFIKQNFKPLFKAMLFIAGPPIILGSILMAQILDNFMNILTYSTQGLDPELDELMGTHRTRDRGGYLPRHWRYCHSSCSI